MRAGRRGDRRRQDRRRRAGARRTSPRACIVEHALAGRSVVRLKGGDPFVFGRGGEEAQRCVADGHPVRGRARRDRRDRRAAPTRASRSPSAASPRAVAFVTGHEDPAKPETQIDWPALAAFPGTLVFYMGVRQLGADRRAADRRRAAGGPAGGRRRSAGTFPDQREVHGTLATIAQVAADAEHPGAGDHGRRRRRGARRRELGWRAAARPLAGVQRRRHARPRPGERARRAAARARGRASSRRPRSGSSRSTSSSRRSTRSTSSA